MGHPSDPSRLGEALQINHRFIDGKISTTAVSLEEGGSFAMSVQLTEPQLVTLTYDDDRRYDLYRHGRWWVLRTVCVPHAGHG